MCIHCGTQHTNSYADEIACLQRQIARERQIARLEKERFRRLVESNFTERCPVRRPPLDTKI